MRAVGIILTIQIATPSGVDSHVCILINDLGIVVIKVEYSLLLLWQLAAFLKKHYRRILTQASVKSQKIRYISQYATRGRKPLEI